MAVRTYLSQVMRLERRIRALRDRQRRYWELGLSCGEEGRARMRALAAEQEADIAEYVRRVREVESVIDAVEDEKYRDVLKYRYLNGWSMQRIAKDMGYSEDWVWRLHRQALRAVRLPM